MSPRSPLARLSGILLAVLALAGCRDAQPYRQTRFLMGTLVEIAAFPNTPETVQAVDAAFRRMEAIEDQARPSHGETPAFTVSEGEPLALTRDVDNIIAVADSIFRASDGAFDPTVGALVTLWGFGVGSPRLPEDASIHDALSSVGFGRLERRGGNLSAKGGTVLLDLGGVTEGYAVDEALKVLQAARVRAAVVDGGGDLAVMGVRPGRGSWRIGIQDPDDAQGLLGVLKVKRGAVATSGDYERFFVREGVRYHHILDPATGYPARSGLRSVTILADTCATADALATAVFVLGPEKGQAMLRGLSGVEAILVDDAGGLHTTPGIGREVEFEKR